MAIEKILVVDDESLIRDFLAETLSRKNIEVTVAENGKRAYELLKENVYDIMITDMKLPDSTGIDILKKCKELSPQTIVIIITAFGSIDNAVEAMRLGAFNYLLKPFSPDTIEALIEKAQEHASLLEENSYLRHQVSTGGNNRNSFELVSKSPSMQKIMDDVLHVAKSNASVFIHGESGTGKEVIAHAIHYNSLRANRPFIKVNCAAVPDTLIESEFFGHEKGSFTGANTKRLGRFELANSGTLLLDEISEVPLPVQAKLLRAIQEQEFERVGGSKPVKVDVRLISTSNRNIKEMIESKMLREDLFYRLNVVPIHLPPLRERKDDILLLAEYFLARQCADNHKEIKTFTENAKQKLLDYDWPGNIRELANVIERAVVLDQTSVVDAEHLYLENQPLMKSVSASSPVVKKIEKIETPTSPYDDEMIPLKELEKRHIIETLSALNNNRTKAAEKLGISIRTLRNKLKEYQIQ